PLAHDLQPHAARSTIPTGKLAGVEPPAIVHYRDAVLVITALHPDAHAVSTGMLADIGERLLNDARQLHHRSGRQVNERLILHDQLDIQPVQAMIPVQMCAYGSKKLLRRGGTL